MDTRSKELMIDLVRSIHVIMRRLGVTTFSSRNLIILSSCGDKGTGYKFSWHIVIAGFVVANNRENKAFYKLVMDELNFNYKDNHKSLVDDNVYHSTQEFRMVGNHKRGSDRALKICNGYWLDVRRIEGVSPENFQAVYDMNVFFDTLVSCTYDCVDMPAIIPPINIPRTFTANYNNATELELEEARNLFMKHPLSKVFEFTNYFSSERGGGVGFKRIKSYRCDCCGRIHDKNGMFLTVNDDIVNLFCQSNTSNPPIFIGNLRSVRSPTGEVGEIPEAEGDDDEPDDVSVDGDIQPNVIFGGLQLDAGEGRRSLLNAFLLRGKISHRGDTMIPMPNLYKAFMETGLCKFGDLGALTKELKAHPYEDFVVETGGYVGKDSCIVNAYVTGVKCVRMPETWESKVKRFWNNAKSDVWTPIPNKIINFPDARTRSVADLIAEFVPNLDHYVLVIIAGCGHGKTEVINTHIKEFCPSTGPKYVDPDSEIIDPLLQRQGCDIVNEDEYACIIVVSFRVTLVAKQHADLSKSGFIAYNDPNIERRERIYYE